MKETGLINRNSKCYVFWTTLIIYNYIFEVDRKIHSGLDQHERGW